MSYRVVRDDSDEEFGDPSLLDGPTVDDRDGHRVPITFKSHLRRFTRSVFAERPVAREHFRELVKARCDRCLLRSWLYVLASPTLPLARADLEKAATQLNKAGRTVFEIELSAHAGEIDPDRRFVGLHRVLWDYGRQLSRVAPTATKHGSPAREEALARLAAHVEARTGNPSDEAVAALVDAVRDWAAAGPWGDEVFDADAGGNEIGQQAYSTEAHNKWCRRHADLISGFVSVARQHVAGARERVAARSGLRGKRPRQRYIPTALTAARLLYPERGWRP